jgi:hypothetical protein
MCRRDRETETDSRARKMKPRDWEAETEKI